MSAAWDGLGIGEVRTSLKSRGSGMRRNRRIVTIQYLSFISNEEFEFCRMLIWVPWLVAHLYLDALQLVSPKDLRMASQNSMGLGGVWGGLDYHKGVVGTLVRCDHWFLYDPILCVRGGLTKTDYHLIASNKTYFHSPLQRDCFSCLTTRHKELNELINVSLKKTDDGLQANWF